MENLGITDATEVELKELLAVKDVHELDHYLADMISFRAQLGVKLTLNQVFNCQSKIFFFYQWSTHGHSGVDVNLYAYGIGSEYLIGNHENIEIGEFITKALVLNLTKVSLLLNE